MSGVLQPGEVIKPELDEGEIAELIRNLYGFTSVSNLKEFNSYDDRNVYFECGNGKKYILKVTNTRCSLSVDFHKAQNAMMSHLHGNGFVVPLPQPDSNGNDLSVQTMKNGKNHLVRILSFVEGSTFYEISAHWNERHYVQCGNLLAELHLALEGFDHDGFEGRQFIWMMTNTPKLKEFLKYVEDDRKRKLAEFAIDGFSARVKPAESRLQSGILHGDFNEQNILVDKNDVGKVIGTIDFGDTHKGCYVFDVAIGIFGMMTSKGMNPDQVDEGVLRRGRYFLEGYLARKRLPELDLEMVQYCVAARLAMSLVMGTYTFAMDPSNSYVMTTQNLGWKILELFWNYGKDQLRELWNIK